MAVARLRFEGAVGMASEGSIVPLWGGTAPMLARFAERLGGAVGFFDTVLQQLA
jgi:hypothetical protein